MAITLTNNWIILPETEPLWMNIQGDLTDYIKSRKIVTTKKIVTIPAKNLYAYSRKDGYVYIPIGLYPFFTDYIELGMEVIDKRTISNPQLIETKEYIEHIFDYQDILPGITLRKEQLMAIRKILYAKRGIIQMATGCFTGDTRVPLTDGTVKRFDELINDYSEKCVFTSLPDGTPSVSKIKSVHITRTVSELLEITLDDKSTIKCTENHPFMLRNGTYKKAEDLTVGESLMPYTCQIRKKHKNGLNKVIVSNNIVRGREYLGKIQVHRLVYETFIGSLKKGYDVHHKDHNHFNDSINNLELLSKKDHFAEHGTNNSEIQSSRSVSNWKNNYEHMKEVCTKSIISYNKSEKGKLESKNRAAHMRQLQKKYKMENPELYSLKCSLASIKSNCKRYHNNFPTNCEKCCNTFNTVYARALQLDPNFEKWNHKIKAIRKITLDHEIPVYDLEVDNIEHNFAIQTTFTDSEHEFVGSGVYVHNSGKSEVICGTCKILSEVNKGKYPTVLILEPTVKLVGDMVKRFHKYGLPVVAYSKTRVIHPNMINVAHPKSLGIDLSKNPNLLSNVEVLFGDETHHMQSDTFRIPTYSMSSLIYSIGVSASAINQDHVSCKRLGDFTIDELLVMGSTGPLLMNITAEYLINKEDLAKPILLRLTNPADELLSKPVSQDWHEISKVRLESMRRNSLICKAAKQFSDLNRKVLILVNTIEWSQKLLGLFDNFGLSERVFASYGSNKFQTCHNGNYYSDKTINYFDDFESGKYNIMIGTSHLYEGADIKNLDVIILAFGGKAERLQVQGLGRALRKSKTGKYAYVVDFTDNTDNVLSYQSSIRFKRYKDIFGIPNENIYDNIPVYEITKILSDREDDIK